jgi:hypothetical protein
MKTNAETSFLDVGLYLGYMNYHATGEGVRSCISIAGSAGEAARLIKERLPEYFHAGVITEAIVEGMDSQALRMLNWIPAPVKEALARMPRGAGEYFSELYYNLA